MFLPLKTLLLVLVCATMSGCTQPSRPSPEDIAQRVFGGPENMMALLSARSVIAFAVHASLDPLRANDPAMAGYAQSEKVKLSDSQLVLLQQLLQQPSSYDFTRTSACIPHYDILFVIHTSPQDIRIGLCFSCGQLAVLQGERTLNDVDNFSPMRPQLMSLAKTLFPNDPEIQRLQ